MVQFAQPFEYILEPRLQGITKNLKKSTKDFKNLSKNIQESPISETHKSHIDEIGNACKFLVKLKVISILALLDYFGLVLSSFIS